MESREWNEGMTVYIVRKGERERVGLILGE